MFVSRSLHSPELTGLWRSGRLRPPEFLDYTVKAWSPFLPLPSPATSRAIVRPRLSDGVAPANMTLPMAEQNSFDITSNVDLQEVDNALNQARKEVAQRYDFKGTKAAIDFDAKESKLTLSADDEFKLNALWEIVQTRLVRRNVPVKNLTRGTAQAAANSTIRQEISLQQGIPTEKARDIVKFIKDAKLKKVQASIQGDQLRVTSPSRDELQEVMRLLREQDFGVALQFGNYRG